MNEDCVFLILENLNCGDLLNVAQIDDKFSKVAADVFRCKYSHFQIVVNDMFPLPNTPNELLNVADMKIDTDTIDQVNVHSYAGRYVDEGIHERGTQINVENGDGLLNIFKHFGHFIKKLKSTTDSRERPLQSRLIGKLISKFSSESLINIEIEHNAEKLLEQITRPLINVESVTFRDNEMSFDPQNIRINEIFPNMRRLHLCSLKYHELAYFNRHFPHLEHVSVIRSYKDEPFPFPDVISKNPQIRSIRLDYTDFKFVQKVNTLLPQLETLKVYNFYLFSREGNIQFENVTTFAIGHLQETSLLNLHFPRLQTLQFIDSIRSNEFFAFLNEHNRLRKLYLKIDHMSGEIFQQLLFTANLNDLETLNLDNHYRTNTLSSNVIVEFLNNHKKMNQLKAINFSKQCEDELQERLKHAWNVSTISGGLSFTRETNNQL